ncbi:hypothetical protein RDI58_004567 [Solanum bulbocastanum]|uniref:Uncharacterized protein n=1 Tax=Solanum bulbocastanum TaxID=147425 RepID=A0AAN8U646_SOLBU
MDETEHSKNQSGRQKMEHCGNKAVVRPTEIMKKTREESKGRFMRRIHKGIKCKDRKWIDNLYV